MFNLNYTKIPSSHFGLFLNAYSLMRHFYNNLKSASFYTVRSIETRRLEKALLHMYLLGPKMRILFPTNLTGFFHAIAKL